MAEARVLIPGEDGVVIEEEVLFYPKAAYEYLTKNIMPIVKRLSDTYSKNGTFESCLDFLAGRGKLKIAGLNSDKVAIPFCKSLEKRLRQAELAFSRNKALGVHPHFSINDLRYYVIDSVDQLCYTFDASEEEPHD